MLFCPNFKRIIYRHTSASEAHTYYLRNTGVPKSYTFTSGTLELARIRCKSWQCPFCAVKNSLIWKSHLKKELPNVSDNWRMVTLTAHSLTRTEQKSYKNLQRGFDVLLKRARRIWVELEYVRVYEMHPTSQALHIHILFSGLTDFVERYRAKNGKRSFRAAPRRTARKGFWTVQSWFKVAAQEAHIGYQCDVQKVATHAAANYVTKYLTKDQQAISVKGLRHVAMSGGIPRLPKKKREGWQVDKHIAMSDVRQKEEVVDLSRKMHVERSVLRVKVFYPSKEDNE